MTNFFAKLNSVNKMSHRKALLVFVLAIFQLFGLNPALSSEPLRLAVSQTPLSLPLFVADSQGYFLAEGLPIKIVDTIGGSRALQLVIDGKADLATCSEAVVMFNSFQPSNFAIITSFVTADDDLKIIARSDSKIATVGELAGKKIGVVPASASEYFFDTQWLLSNRNSLPVYKQNIPPELMVDALKRGDVDAISIWEPFAFSAIKESPGSYILPKTSRYRLSFNLVADKNILGARDDDLVKLLRALDRAQTFIKKEPLKAQSILRDRLKLDQSFIDWIWTRYNYHLTLDQSLITTLESEARWAQSVVHKKIGPPPNYLSFIYTLPMRKVRPSAVTVIE
jgi:NitT/TauT family transport system substrate-binding protein